LYSAPVAAKILKKYFEKKRAATPPQATTTAPKTKTAAPTSR
jgi:hypothetical protein